MKKLRKTLDDYGISKFSKAYEMPCGDRLEITLKAGRDDSFQAIGGGSVLKFYANYGRHIGGWAMDIDADGHIDYPELYNHTHRVIEAFNIFLSEFSRNFQEYVRHYEDDEFDESSKGKIPKFVKEGFYKGEIASRSVDKLASIEGDLVSICNDIKLVFGKDSDVFAKVDLLRTGCGKALDLLDNALKGMKYDEPVRLSESGDGSAWFDARGDLLKPLPGQCIEDCSGSGRVDDEVAYWVNALKFDLGLPRERAIKFLSEYGAWELDELDGMDDFNLAEKVLWIFCGDLKELAYEMMDDETSLVADWGDPSTWGDDEWERFQKEYSYCSLNN